MVARVIVVGSVNVDLVVRAPRLPRPGETVSGGEFARHDGGKGGNQAIAAARLGAWTALIGALGDDDLAADARAALDAEGVNTHALVTVRDTPIGVALIVVDPAGENLITVAPGANARLTPALVAAALERLAVSATDVVLVGHEIPTPTAREALRRARGAGATTILNPAPAAGLDRGVLGLADVLTPNRGELAELAGAETRRTGRRDRGTDAPALMAAALIEPSSEGEGPRAILVSLGASGAILVRPGRPATELAAPSVDAVDATGAGDALNGALAAGLAAGHGLEHAAHRAVLAATRSTLRPGARTGLVTLGELDALVGGATQGGAPTPAAKMENA